ncbi:hypothetical protein Tco_0511169 [Tanacetum coccineum]
MLAIQAEEGEGLGHPSEAQPPPSTAQPIHEEPVLNVVSSSHQKTQTPRQALKQVTELPQTSEPIPNVPDEAVYEEWDDRVERATITAASLDAEHASVNINRTQSTAIPNVPLPQGIGAGGSPRVHTLRSDEVNMPLLELTVLCTTLSKKMESLEADLKQTKNVYGAAYTKLIKKVKKLEKIVKSNQARRRGKIMVSDDEEDLEDSSKQGRMIEEIDQDARVTLVTPIHSQEDQPEDQLGFFSAAKVLADAAKENVHNYTRIRRVVSTGNGGISTASRLFRTAKESVSTAGASIPVSTTSMVQEVNISIPSPVIVKDKGKGKMKESKDEQRKINDGRVHEASQSFTEEEWENIRARVKVDEELSRRLQAEERNKYNEVDQAKMLELFESTMKNVNAFIPTETEDREGASKLTAGSSQATIIYSAKVRSSKRAAEVELDHEGSKKQKTNEASGLVQEQPEEEEKELSQEDLQQMMMVVPGEEVYVEAL